MNQTVGVRELKSNLSAYLEKAQKGQTIIITSHGKPVAQLTPAKEELMERVKALQAAGLILWSGKKPVVKKPKVINRSGKQVSDIYLEMQNESIY
jgi:prevent-host-death family protein